MEWISAKEGLPKHAQVVLGWGHRLEGTYDEGFYLCAIDMEEGWKHWPSLDILRIFYWVDISGPNGEGETLYVMDDKSGME